MKLNPRQEKFCLEFAKSGNAGGSYQKIYGTSNGATAATNAYRLLKNADIQSRLKEIQDELASERIMDAREIQERLSSIARGEVTEEIITSDGERIRKQAAVKDVLRALELLAKCKGMFVAQVDVKATVPVVISGGDCLVD